MAEKYSELAARIYPLLLPKIERLIGSGNGGEAGAAGGGATGAPTPHDLSGVHHTGTLANAQAPQFLLLDGSRQMTGNLDLAPGKTVDGVDIPAHVADPDVHHARVTAGSGITVAGQVVSLGTPATLTSVTTNLVSGVAHTHAIAASFDADGSPGALLKSDGSGNLEVVGLTADSITADADLTLDPAGNVVIPNAQEVRTTNIADLITGISGMRMYERGSNYRQITTGALKVDELYARVFVADEVRIDRGEEYWSKSFGIVEQDFVWPAYGVTVDVWFEDAPGLSAGNLFTTGDWLYGRAIDWGTGMATWRGWAQIVDGGGPGGRVTRDANYRQMWRLLRLSAGEALIVIKKGTLFLDVGASGQGWVHLSALRQDGGPYIEIGDWSANRGATAPNNVPFRPDAFLNRVRMGNLNGAAGYAVDTWGFAAGSDLSLAVGSTFQGVTVEATNGLRLWNVALQGYSGASMTSSLTPAGTLKLGTDVTGAAGTTFAVFPTAQTFGTEAMGAGDVIIGRRSASNVHWNNGLGRLEFRGDTTVQAYADTDGMVKAGGGNVTLSANGLRVAPSKVSPAGTLPSTLIEIHDGTTRTGYVWGHWYSGTNAMAMVTDYIVGQTTVAQVTATGPGAASAFLQLTAEAAGATSATLFADTLVVSTDAMSVNGALTLNSTLALQANQPINFLTAGGVERSAMYFSSGSDLVIGEGITATNFVSIAPAGVGRLIVSDTTITARLPVLLDGADAITLAPPTALSNTGWKLGLFSNTWAIGVSALSLCFRVGANGWLAAYNNVNPVVDATATSKASNAFFGVNVNYLQYDGAIGEAWSDASGFGTNWGAATGMEAPGYKKFGDRVYLCGAVATVNTNDTNANRLFTLPVGYRPGGKRAFSVACKSEADALGTGVVEVNTDGTLFFLSGNGSKYVALDTITFTTTT